MKGYEGNHPFIVEKTDFFDYEWAQSVWQKYESRELIELLNKYYWDFIKFKNDGFYHFLGSSNLKTNHPAGLHQINKYPDPVALKKSIDLHLLDKHWMNGYDRRRTIARKFGYGWNEIPQGEICDMVAKEFDLFKTHCNEWPDIMNEKNKVRFDMAMERGNRNREIMKKMGIE